MPATDKIVEATVESVIEKKVETLLADAKQRIDELKKQEQLIHQFESNLDVLMKRYFVEKSFFDKAAHWYGSLGFLKKTLLIVSYVVTCLLIASFLSLAITLLLIGLAVVSHTALTNHHRIETNRCQRFCEDIQKLEHDLTEQMVQLKEVEVQLKTVLLSLNQELIRLIENNSNLEQAIATLNTQMIDLTASVTALELVKTNITTQNQVLISEINRLENALSAQVKELKNHNSNQNTLNQSLSEAQLALGASQQDLTQIHTLYQQRIARLHELDALFGEQLSILTANVKKDAEIRTMLQNEPNPSLSKSTPLIEPQPYKIIEEEEDEDELSDFEHFLEQANDYTKTCAAARQEADNMLKPAASYPLKIASQQLTDSTTLKTVFVR